MFTVGISFMITFILSHLKAWVTQYDHIDTFYAHKTVHVLAGLILGLLVVKSTMHTLDPTIGIVVAILSVTACAIAKEIFDHIQTKGPYQATTSSHIIDVIVTVLGGVLGIVVALLIS
jgi:VanZ family protein